MTTQNEQNTLFIRKFKKDNNIKVQTKLPSRVEADNAKAVTNGYAVVDATWFRRFMEEAKYDPVAYGADLISLFEMARTCASSPVGLVNFGRTNYGWKQFGHDEIVYLREHMLADHDDEDGGDAAETGSYEDTSEPYLENPNSAEAYEIDDDQQAAASASTSSRKRKVRSLAEPGDD